MLHNLTYVLLPALWVLPEPVSRVGDGRYEVARGLVAEKTGHGGVGRQDVPVARDPADAHGGILEDRTVLLLGPVAHPEEASSNLAAAPDFPGAPSSGFETGDSGSSSGITATTLSLDGTPIGGHARL